LPCLSCWYNILQDALFTAIVALLIGAVFFVIVALSCQCLGNLLLLLLGKCCTLDCYQSSALDDKWLEIVHECQNSMAAAGVGFYSPLCIIICHGLLQLTVLLVVAIDEEEVC
jgi:hypothetical protein